MEDSGEVRTEENKVALDVNKKRTVKTAAQVLALENFYKEHKFPTDEMKAKMAVQIGLTEKQISSWFCHRRLKDKKRDESCANGRQDHSSGVIQDRGSGLRQDSCGSIKQGDFRNVDPREVESQRVYGHEFLAADLTSERRSHQNPYDTHREDTSSESSLSLHDQLLSETQDPYDMQISPNLTQNGAIAQINSRGTKSMGYKPSGYLKVKGESEHPAITAVKRQLGRLYQEDGPLLSVEFDSVPPGAFEFPSSKLDSEPIFFGDPRQGHSADISGAIKQLNPINEVNKSKKSSKDTYKEGANIHTMHGSERQDRKPHHQLKYKSSSLCSNSFPGQKTSLDIYKGSAGKTALSDCKWSRMTSKQDVERLEPDSFPDHPGIYGGKIANEQEKPWLHDDDNHTYKAPKNKNLSKTSNLIHGGIESLGSEAGRSARMAKVEKLVGDWKPKREHPVRVKMDPANELRVDKRIKVEFPRQDFVANTSNPGFPPPTNQAKGSSMDVPSSFSEDETAETSCSLD